MKKIIEIGGIDTSGKSTLIDNLIPHLNKSGVSSQKAPKRFPMDSRIPRKLIDRMQWYRDVPVSEIVSANLYSSMARDNNMSNMDGDIIFEDRGFITIYASSMAHYMQREKSCLEEAGCFVDSLNKEIGYFPKENWHFILEFNNGQSAAENYIKRSGEHPRKGFLEYLCFFDMAIARVSERFRNINTIDAEKEEYQITKDVASLITGAL
jgi:thymidylate kinase